MADPLAKPTDSPVMEMTKQIRARENGQEIGIDALINFQGLTPGTKFRLYRMAERDIKCEKPAVFEMQILSVDTEHRVINFNGSYKSGSKNEMEFINHTLVITLDGSIISSLPNQPGTTMYIRRNFEEALLFTDSPVNGGVTDDIVRETHDSVVKPPER